MSCQAAIPRAGPLARCIAKLTENRKSPERPIVSGFPGIDTKTALQIGRLFLYESLFLNMVEAGGIEPPSESSLTGTSPGAVCYLPSLNPAGTNTLRELVAS